MGIQTREVYCLHPGESPAPAEECGDEKPHALQACNQFDCPPSWHIEEWQQVIWQPGAPFARHTYGCKSPDSPSFHLLSVPGPVVGELTIEESPVGSC